MKKDKIMITITFWGNLDSQEPFVRALFNALSPLIAGGKVAGDSFIYTLRDKTELTLGTPNIAKTYDGLQSQIKALTNFYQKVPTDKPKVLAGVVEQIANCNIMLGIAFEDTGDKDRLNHILSGVLVSAGKLGGVVLLANKDLLDGKGNMLFSHTGKSDYEEFFAYQFVDNVYNKDIKPSAEDEQRYATSKSVLTQKSVPIVDNATFELKKAECTLRGLDEIAKRLFGLFQVATFSECMLDDELGQIVALQELGKLSDKFNSSNYVTMRELQYLNSTEFDKDLGTVFVWRYEALGVLCWALGLVENLGEPDQICDSAKLSTFIHSFESVEKVIINAQVRNVDELLQVQDLTMRYYLAFDSGDNLPFNKGVVSERLLALNWILTKKFGRDWDSVDKML